MFSFLKKKNSTKIEESFTDKICQAVTTVVLVAVLLMVALPVLHVIACSFSDANAILNGQVFFWPVKPTIVGYTFVLQYKQVWIGYRNSIFYTGVGVTLQMFMQILAAYPLSRRRYQGRNTIMKIFFLTTMFSAGLIPTYLVKSSLGMVNTIWAVLLAGLVGVRNVIIMRTALQSSIPGELYDAAEIDGASDIQTCVQIALPLVKATTSVLILYSAVGHWNEYFNSMIYLRNEELYPLQLFLRTILLKTGIDTSEMDDVLMEQAQQATEQIRYSLIVIATAPLIIMYNIVQKYFEKGVMIGSVKG